ncbi:tRNA (uridine(34)/cytosine(34)/5-carboxymethylaminomethyluridine(34)-2'-O)-methyltransferase TrmL [Ketobacter sp. MCCC 1A13808]|uniref:tRNA (uridine(34)/cytosine(34)/5- carboxymethylaminomethyluridine(34)-2'-O)- methyltransferase TrmL n=1 Tax=Ketobacter sp. MCCC 1A13808 TaxID=2602738 RepID=UPI000F238B02|nr:tRNA (uridine(34)/cytosine(34)/5-carboxymethylaminomethyluridine(34)-2'-O)-methyltransferase TrmL [Ketobacter sp. MCCC 1A13808]MVF13885.1 tRNA (uridine(34)/cytosine(34)/5-carboxymethylaminomethyluridine(34)-2'-O)-methyltransferase TrmL [Ketobacter sp. MCCC 1A13808]RLP54935.1 MAG: tRNA (uridine(34)/cytosine(34)/5-carboxymethylaminomethyluridine(34)-2'-O)-methyltransferase TrmL [Ketobacter sp.]
MLHIVLYQPEIPPNTGNIIRLCANTGMQLHLIKPLAFELDDKRMRRAGLDYHEWADLKIHDSFEDFLQQTQPTHCYPISTKGTTHYHQVRYAEGDAIIMGPETRGLPPEVRQHVAVTQCIRIPMKENSRSLNLSNATAIVLYEAWRQLDFAGSI